MRGVRNWLWDDMRFAILGPMPSIAVETASSPSMPPGARQMRYEQRLTSPRSRPAAVSPRRPPLDDGWRQWVAENRLRGCTPESMLATMTGSGLDRARPA